MPTYQNLWLVCTRADAATARSANENSSRTEFSWNVHAIVSDHYSVLADQEPLYQFYAAAVARVAFESDSEGYEEVSFLTYLLRVK